MADISKIAVNGTTYSLKDPTGRKEAYLEWGGKNFSGSYGCIDAAMTPELGANRLAFIPAKAVTVEYSRNSGQTWVDYEATDAQKIALFDGNGTSLVIGKATAGSTSTIATNQYQLRITIATGTGSVYTVLNKFVVYVSTNGTGSNKCTIRARLQSDYESNTDTWRTFADSADVSGWSGYNIINTSGLTTYGYTKTSQYGQIQFIFSCGTGATDTRYCGLQVLKILGFGGVGWTTPSTMAKYGRMYTYDESKNVTFPAAVTATSFSGNASSASKVKDSGNSSDITLAYSKAGLTSTSWLAGWNGYELRAIAPANITAGSATKATQDASGNVITTTYTTKTEFNTALGNVESLLASI